MQEPLFPSTVSQKLYNERAILIATFIGGPLAGGFLLAQNFHAFNEPGKASKTWIATIAVLVLLMCTMFVPALDSIPNVVYSFALCMTAHTLAKKFQGSYIALHQANGGQFYSTWRAVGTGLLFTLVMIVVMLLIMYVQDPSVFS